MFVQVFRHFHNVMFTEVHGLVWIHSDVMRGPYSWNQHFFDTVDTNVRLLVVSLDARFFRRRENFGNESLGRRDRFGVKIIEIGAILAIFEPFENSRFLGCQLLVAPKSQSLTTSRSKKLVANC